MDADGTESVDRVARGMRPIDWLHFKLAYCCVTTWEPAAVAVVDAAPAASSCCCCCPFVYLRSEIVFSWLIFSNPLQQKQSIVSVFSPLGTSSLLLLRILLEFLRKKAWQTDRLSSWNLPYEPCKNRMRNVYIYILHAVRLSSQPTASISIQSAEAGAAAAATFVSNPLASLLKS